MFERHKTRILFSPSLSCGNMIQCAREQNLTIGFAWPGTTLQAQRLFCACCGVSQNSSFNRWFEKKKNHCSARDDDVNNVQPKMVREHTPSGQAPYGDAVILAVSCGRAFDGCGRSASCGREIVPAYQETCPLDLYRSIASLQMTDQAKEHPCHQHTRV